MSRPKTRIEDLAEHILDFCLMQCRLILMAESDSIEYQRVKCMRSDTVERISCMIRNSNFDPDKPDLEIDWEAAYQNIRNAVIQLQRLTDNLPTPACDQDTVEEFINVVQALLPSTSKQGRCKYLIDKLQNKNESPATLVGSI